MRRIIQNTTAIAACLSLLAPHAVMAQAQAPQEGAAQQQQQPAADAPEQIPEATQPCEAGADCDPAAALTEKAAEAIEAEAAPAADAPTTPDAEVEAEAMPEAGAEAAATTDAAEAPAPVAEAPAPDAAEVAPAENTEAPAADDAQKLEDALAAELDRQAEPEAQAEAPLAPEAEAPEPAAPMAEAPVEPAPAEQAPATDAEMTEAPKAAEDPDADDLGAALAEEAQQDQPETAAPDAQAETPAQPEVTDAQPAPAEADAPAQTEAAAPTEEPSLEEALAAEAAANSDQTKPAAKPQQQQDPAPKPVQQQAADQQAPEQGATETEAATEAANNTQAPTAAALDDEAGGEVTEEQVTEENSRSSGEDFTANLRDALAGAANQQQATREDDDDDNDLTKALLLGLGGVAVGAMLNNNRQVELSTPDRVVVTRQDGSRQVIKDEVALLRQPGSTVSTENFDDGSSRTVVTRADGSKVVTIRDADLRVLRRTLVSADGQSVRLIDDTTAEPVDIAQLPAPAQTSAVSATQLNEQDLRDALLRESQVDRRFTLAQIRDIPQVRSLVAPVDIDAVTFETGSAAIKSDQAKELSNLGNVIRDAVAQNPREIFLNEGHTDTVGSDAANLALSDRRAESVALALTEYFDVPPENMVVQGYGEQFPKIRQEGDIRENRRAAVRRITDLMQTAQN